MASSDFVILLGALTPTEALAAWRAGSDPVKVVPVGAMGGENYIKAPKAPPPEISLIAAGGVNQQTAAAYMVVSSVALGVPEALLPWEAVALRQSRWIRELARRFLNIAEAAHREDVSRSAGPASASRLTLRSVR